MADNQEEIGAVDTLQAAGELVYFIFSGIRSAFTLPEPESTPTPYRHFTPNFPEDHLNRRDRQTGPPVARHQEPIDQRSPTPVERPPSPNGRMPGTWDTSDYLSTVSNVEATVTGLQEEVSIQPDPGPVEEPNDRPQLQVENDGEVDDNNQPPATSHDDIAPQDSNEVVASAEPSASPVVNHVTWKIDPPAPSRSSSPRPSTIEEVRQSSKEGEEPSTSSTIEEARQGSKGDEPSTSKSQPAGSTQTTSPRPPVINEDNRSQDHLSVLSYGDGSTSSVQESSGKKGMRKKIIGYLKSPFKKRDLSGKGKGPEPPTNAPDTTQKPNPQTKYVGWVKLDIDDLGGLDRPCPSTWGELLEELAPLVAVTHIIQCLQTIFDFVDAIKTNKVHWRGLRSQCVSMSRLLAFQYRNYGRDEGRRKLVDDVCKTVFETLRDIESSARKWSDKSLIAAFAQFEVMAKDISLHIERLNASRETLNTALGMATEFSTGEIVANQKVELEETRELHRIVNQQTDALEQLKQLVKLSERRREEFEKDVTSALQQHMFQGDDTDIEKTIDFIVSLTGVQLPAEYFLKKVCTNVSPDPIKRASTASVYKARFTGGQLVAKKVFEIGKYSEGDVKTYAEKMRRDIREWRKFASPYTLQCLGIGMEKSSDGTFKMYMVSPFIENMDAMTYLEPLRGLVKGRVTLRIDKRRILHIVQGAALGLVEVHRHNSVHSNMRGDNVLVGGDGMGILGGFGLTKSLQNHKTGRLAAVEQTGQDPPYRWMAPECVDPDKTKPDVTQANDVWGWAMATLQIVTGAPPIRSIKNDLFLYSDDAQSRFTTKREEYPEFELFAHQPDALWLLLTQCWNRDPNKRPSMQDVARQLTQIISRS